MDCRMAAVKPLSSAQWYEVHCALAAVRYPQTPGLDLDVLKARVRENQVLTERIEVSNAASK